MPRHIYHSVDSDLPTTQFPQWITEHHPFDETALQAFHYDPTTNHLSFLVQSIRHDWTNEGVATQTVESQYQFDQMIDPKEFCETTLYTLPIAQPLQVEICAQLGYQPTWLNLELAISNLEQETAMLQTQLVHYHPEIFRPLPTNYPEQPSRLWLRLLLAPITLGFSFLNFVSRAQVKKNIQKNQLNQELNQRNWQSIQELNAQDRKQVDAINAPLEVEIRELQAEIIQLRKLVSHPIS